MLEPSAICRHLLSRLCARSGVIACGVILAAASTFAQSPIGSSDEVRSGLTSEFVENLGQWQSAARFRSLAGGLVSWITDRGVVYDIGDAAGDRGHVVRMSFDGATRDAVASGTGVLEGLYNYFRGSDASRWVSGVRRFSGVRIDRLHEGIDAVFYVDSGVVRYDLVVAPLADPSRARLRFEGADSIRVGADGSLRISTSVGVLEQRGLFAYQESNGRRTQVACRFDVATNGGVGFVLGSYDRSRPLVIDPLIYSTLIGGADVDVVRSVATGSDSSVYVTGSTYSSDFPVTAGAYRLRKSSGLIDMFVARLSGDGSRLIYATFIGATMYSVGKAIAVDRDGSAYVTGVATDGYPTTPEAFDRTFDRYFFYLHQQAVVTKLSPNGDQLVYSTYLGSAFPDEGLGIAVDDTGNAYVVGYTHSPTHPTSPPFPTTPGAFDTVRDDPGDSVDAFVTKLNPAGSALVYSTLLGGTGIDYATGVAVDAQGNAYVVGVTRAANFPTSEGAFARTQRGGTDAFAVKLDATGSRLVYGTLLGGTAYDSATAVAVGPDGSAYVTGVTFSTDYPTSPGAMDPTRKGASDAFVTKVSPDGRALTYSTHLGGNGNDAGHAIAVDPDAIVYVTGVTDAAGFPTTPGAHNVTQTVQSAYLTVFAADGASLRYSTFIGGPSSGGLPAGNGVAIAAGGDAIVVGQTSARDFPTTEGAFSRTLRDTDGFIARLRPSVAVDPDARITVTSPASGGVLCAGLPSTITWTSQGVSVVSIALSSNDGATWGTVVAPAVDAAPGSFTWLVPSGLTEGSYRIRVMAVGNPGVAGITSGPFTIRSWALRAQPEPTGVLCPGVDATLVVVTETPPLAVQWEVSYAQGPFTEIPGATATRYELQSVRPELNNDVFRARVRLECGEVTTPAFRFAVSDSIRPVPDLPVLDTVRGIGSVTIGTTPTATDNCAGIVQGTTSDPLTYAAPGTYGITWTYDDGNRNRIDQPQIVIVEPGTVGVDDRTRPAVAGVRVVPNPVEHEARLRYTVARASHVTISIHDALGRTVAELVDGTAGAGEHSVTWRPGDDGALPSGGYVYRATIDGVTFGGRIVLMR